MTLDFFFLYCFKAAKSSALMLEVVNPPEDAPVEEEMKDCAREVSEIMSKKVRSDIRTPLKVCLCQDQTHTPLKHTLSICE